jgi:hypothetical protein
LKHPTVSVSPPDFLNCSDNRNSAVGDRFCHFQRFYSLTTFLKEFSQFFDKFFIVCTFINNDFHHRRRFAALAGVAKQICASVRARTGWGRGI